MQEKIDRFNAAFVDMAVGYVKHIANKMAGNTAYTTELPGGPLRWGTSLADEVRAANLLAATISKMQAASGGELLADVEPHTAADKLDFLRDFLEGKTRWNFPEGTVFNVNVSTGDGAEVKLKPETDGEPEPPAGPEPVTLGPGASFRLEKTQVSGPCSMEDSTGAEALFTLKDLCGYCRMLAKNKWAIQTEREWDADVVALEFAISVLSELREIKEVRIPAEPNTPGAWELIRDILAGKRPAPEGTVFDVVIDMAGNPQAIRSREEPEPAPRALAIDMPGGETVKLNSAAEAYRLAGCIEEMAARVWPKVKPDAPQDKPGE